jgi:hypothetical protein
LFEKWAVITVVLAVAAGWGCRSRPVEHEGEKSAPFVAHRHPNGLTLELPGELSAVPSDDGFSIRPASYATRRNYDETRVRLVGPGALPPGDWPDRRAVGDVTYLYRIEPAGEGSGGQEWKLVARADLGGHIVLCEHYTQSELAKPDFEPAWRLLAGVRVGSASPSVQAP